jgi:hypothetical protein
VFGAAVVFFKYPKKEDEHQLEAKFHADDMAALAALAPKSAATPAPAAASSAKS